MVMIYKQLDAMKDIKEKGKYIIDKERLDKN